MPYCQRCYAAAVQSFGGGMQISIDELHQTADDKLWRKQASTNEKTIFDILGSHPRIVKYLGYDSTTEELILKRHHQGDLLAYLSEHVDLSLPERIKCAVQIAEGLAHLHSKNVEWYDAHLANVLKTDDGVVICDFASSFHCPPSFRNHYPDFLPPGPYALPTRHLGRKISQDIFAFGVMLFVLLTGQLPYAQTCGLYLDAEECKNIHDKHEAGDFDSLTDQRFLEFDSVVQKCFLGSYQSANELLLDLKLAAT